MCSQHLHVIREQILKRPAVCTIPRNVWILSGKNHIEAWKPEWESTHVACLYCSWNPFTIYLKSFIKITECFNIHYSFVYLIFMSAHYVFQAFCKILEICWSTRQPKVPAPTEVSFYCRNTDKILVRFFWALLHPYEIAWKILLLSFPFYRWGNWGALR